MTTWPDPERQLIARYLAGLGLRRASCAYYKQVLNSFQDVAECHAELGKDILIAWLQTLFDHWMATTLPRSSCENRSDRAQSRRRLVRGMQYQAMSAGLARTGVA